MAEIPHAFGIVGNASSGKDFVARQFVERGFAHVSGSDVLREVIRERGLEPSRELQTQVANELRLTHDAAFFIAESIRRAREVASGDGRIVISGIYAPIEASFARSQGLRIVGVVRPGEQDSVRHRYDVLRARADGSRDALSFEEFAAAHTRENAGLHAGEANVARLLAEAEHTIVNDGISADNIALQIEELIKE